MIKIQKRWIFLGVVFAIYLWIFYYHNVPLTEQEQIEEQESNLHYWFSDMNINADFLKYKKKYKGKNRITGKYYEEFQWFYIKEDGTEVIASLPVIHKRADMHTGIGPSFSYSDTELIDELQEKSEKQWHPERFNKDGSRKRV